MLGVARAVACLAGCAVFLGGLRQQPEGVQAEDQQQDSHRPGKVAKERVKACGRRQEPARVEHPGAAPELGPEAASRTGPEAPCGEQVKACSAQLASP